MRKSRRARRTGQPINNALRELASGDAELATGDFESAYDQYRRAYREAVKN